VSGTVADAAAPSTPPAANVTDVESADLASETSGRTDWPDSAQTGETTTAPNRDYNFFDELDERLADR
jgi:hypothetical protein